MEAPCRTPLPTALRPLPLLSLGLLAAAPALGFPQTLTEWTDRHGAISPSGEAARCQLCHGNENGGVPWNAYGWDLRDALADPACDGDGDLAVGSEEAFFCIEADNSDLDGSGYTNLDEIGLGTQPGWTDGPNNTLYDDFGTTPGVLPACE